MTEKKMTAEERVRDLFDHPTGPLEDCDRAACAELLVSLMKEHAAAAVAEVTQERDDLRHSHALISVDIERWRTDCSTPVYQMVRNAVADYKKAERERDEALAEVERLREALTPSEETKAAYIGEVTEPDATRAAGKRTVSWTAIKDVMALIRQRAALKAADGGEGER